MSKEVITDALILIGEYDVSGHHSQVAVSYGADTPEVTGFGDDTHVMTGGGLHTVGWSGKAYWHADTSDERPDLTYQERVGAAAPVVIGKGKAEGDRAYLLDGGLSSYAPLDGSVGDMHTVAIDGYAASGLIRATLMENRAISADGNGTPRQLGQVDSDQGVYAGLFVLSASGTDPTLDMTVESDDAEGFGAPTTRLTFGQFTASGTARLDAGGAVADDWWRVSWAVGGTDPSFSFVLVLGIQ